MRILTLLFVFLCAGPTFAQVAKYGTFQHDGLTREHYIFVPNEKGPNTPLFVALHGMGGNAKNLRFGIGLTKRAEEDGFAVLYPQGIRLPQGSRHWNAGFDFSDIDDLGYLDALIEHVMSTHGLNRRRLTVFGISNGGYMTYRMACLSKHPIHAAAIVAGTISKADWSHCPAPYPVSVLHIHGTEDPMIHFEGMAEGMLGWAQAPAVPDLIAKWAEKLNATPVETLTNYETLHESRYRNALTGAEVQLLALEGFGHDWPNLSNGPIKALDYLMKFVDRVNAQDYRVVSN